MLFCSHQRKREVIVNKNLRYFAAVFVPVVAGVMLWAATARAQRGGPDPNAPPTVVAYCDPCTVDLGKTASVHAYSRDPINGKLKISWTAKAGTFADASSKQTVWTAPTQEGPVEVKVTVDNGHGTASDTISITVRSSQ